jgi:multidrug efflux pump subunit AcrA (membrane-fusion protein)
MFARSVFANYFRLLAGVSLAMVAIALAGCNEKVAEKIAPSRPVLVATVHYEAESPERSFVGTIKPRIETDMGFRVPGKIAKRLVEVGQTVDVGQPLATLDDVDLKLQAEQAEAEFRAATGVLAQAAAAEQRAKELRTKGWTTDAQMDQAKAAADEARARLNRAERSVELTTTPYPTQRWLLIVVASLPRPWWIRDRSSRRGRPRSVSRASRKRKPSSRYPRLLSVAPRTVSPA